MNPTIITIYVVLRLSKSSILIKIKKLAIDSDCSNIIKNLWLVLLIFYECLIDWYDNILCLIFRVLWMLIDSKKLLHIYRGSKLLRHQDSYRFLNSIFILYDYEIIICWENILTVIDHLLRKCVNNLLPMNMMKTKPIDFDVSLILIILWLFINCYLIAKLIRYLNDKIGANFIDWNRELKFCYDEIRNISLFYWLFYSLFDRLWILLNNIFWYSCIDCQIDHFIFNNFIFYTKTTCFMWLWAAIIKLH